MSVSHPLDLTALFADAAAAAMCLQQPAPFLDWIRANLTRYAAPGSPFVEDEETRRAFAATLGRSLWNAMPLPRRGFRTEPLPDPGRNDPCPCGSGRKFKHCCAQAPSLGPFTPELLWPFVLGALTPGARAIALQNSHVPREAVLQFTADQIQSGDPEAAIELLEPMFAEPLRHEDAVASHALDLLCDAYDARGNAKRRKRSLLERIGRNATRSPLRSSAHQRLACILMDSGEPAASWAAFRKAQRDDPGYAALGMLEVQLLMSEGRNDEARERAGFFLRQLRRSGLDLEPRVIEFYERIASDPGRAMSDFAFDMERGAGQRLAQWLDAVRSRPLPAYMVSAGDDDDEGPEPMALAERLRQMGIPESEVGRVVRDMEKQLAELKRRASESPPGEEAPQAPDLPPLVTLDAPKAIAAVEKQWHAVFPFGKPFSVHPLPMGGGDPWAPASESRWMQFLEIHPEAFDSQDVLDDLATAAMQHGQADQPGVLDRLSRPLLERSVAILERALADARPAVPPARLAWAATTNRPALRALFRLHEIEMRAGRDAAARRHAERLLALNPDDNHGIRCWLSGAHLRAGDAEACLRIVEAYPGDVSPELQFNAALALFQLGRARGATEALESAHRASPRVTRFLLPKRIARPELSEHGVTLNGDDRGWYYREEMRGTWAALPGALEWVAKVTRNWPG